MRDCPIKMRIMPYGKGWTELYVDFGDGEKLFEFSTIPFPGFSCLSDALYRFNQGELVDVDECEYELEKQSSVL